MVSGWWADWIRIERAGESGDRGRFAYQGQEGNESADEWIQSYQQFRRGIHADMEKLLPWRSSPEQCMPKSASLGANVRGESVTIHALGTRREKDAAYRTLDASQRSR